MVKVFLFFFVILSYLSYLLIVVEVDLIFEEWVNFWDMIKYDVVVKIIDYGVSFFYICVYLFLCED